MLLGKVVVQSVVAEIVRSPAVPSPKTAAKFPAIPMSLCQYTSDIASLELILPCGPVAPVAPVAPIKMTRVN